VSIASLRLGPIFSINATSSTSSSVVMMRQPLFIRMRSSNETILSISFNEWSCVNVLMFVVSQLRLQFILNVCFGQKAAAVGECAGSVYIPSNFTLALPLRGDDHLKLHII
jgi:hypothetical protein